MFIGKVLQKERIHGALKANMQFVDFAFGYCDKCDAGKGELLVETGDVFLVSRYAVHSF